MKQTGASTNENTAPANGQGDGALNFTFMFRGLTPEQMQVNARSFGDLDSALTETRRTETPVPKNS